MALSGLRIAAIVLAVIGIICIIISLAFSPTIYKKIEEGIRDTIQIKTQAEDSKSYWQWVNGTGDPEVVASKYYGYYFFNLTNPQNFAATGAKPEFEEVGPYTYKVKSNKFNISFNNDNSEVTFNEQTESVFDPTKSVDKRTGRQLTADDKLTNLYFPYHTAMRGLSEIPFLVGAFSQLLLQFFVGAFGAMQQITSGTADNTVTALQWGRSAGKASFNVLPQTSFIQSSTVVDTLGASNVANLLQARAVFLGMASLQKYAEFGQFSNTSALTPANSYNLLFGNATAGFNCAWLDGKFGGSTPCTVRFVVLAQQAAATNNPSLLLSEFPLGSDITQVNNLINYLTGITYAFAGNLLSSTSSPFANPAQTLLFVTRKPAAWLFSFTDPLFKLSGFSNTNSAFFPGQQQASKEIAYTSSPGPTTLKTGKADPNEASKYVKFKGLSVLPSRNNNLSAPGVYCDVSESVAASSDSQFTPGTASAFSFNNGVAKSDILTLFNELLSRKVKLDFYEDGNVEGINTYRFRISDSELVVDPTTYSRFYAGVMNMTCPMGLPIYLTNPHFSRIDQRLRPSLPNISAPIFREHETLLDIDPITGATLQGFQRLQVNTMSTILSSNSSQFVYPILWAEKSGKLTKKNAEDYNAKLSKAFEIRTGVVYGLGIGGAFLVAIAIVLFVVDIKKNTSHVQKLQSSQELVNTTPKE